jgi:hypothetical protein
MSAGLVAFNAPQISIFDQRMSKIDQKKSNCGKDLMDTA